MKKILIKLSVLAVIAGARQFSTASAFINHPYATALQATPNRLQQGCQGGAFDCTFAVQPVFTFTRIEPIPPDFFDPDFERNTTPDELDIDFQIPPPEEVIDEEIAWPTPDQKGPLDDTTIGGILKEEGTAGSGLGPKKPPPPPPDAFEQERERQRAQDLENVLKK